VEATAESGGGKATPLRVSQSEEVGDSKEKASLYQLASWMDVNNETCC